MTTFIDTEKCERISTQDLQGDYAEIVNKELCGADNVLGMLRWLEKGQKYNADSLRDTYQVLYLLEGEATASLNGKDYDISTGMGIYLESEETTRVSQRGAGVSKFLHLVVPKLPAN